MDYDCRCEELEEIDSIEMILQLSRIKWWSSNDTQQIINHDNTSSISVIPLLNGQFHTLPQRNNWKSGKKTIEFKLKSVLKWNT